MDELGQLKILTGESDEELLSLFLNRAKSKILDHTNRTEMIDRLVPYQVELAHIFYLRHGMNGESSHSEGGISQSFRSINEILHDTDDLRLARAVKRNREKNQNEKI